MTELDLNFDAAELGRACDRFGIDRLEVFGSFARGSATATSDLDLLYDLRPGARLGWEIEDLCIELNRILGRRIDLIARDAINPMLSSTVLADARPLHDARPAPDRRDDLGRAPSHRSRAHGIGSTP